MTVRLDHPYHFDARGRTATTSAEDHIRDLVEQVLFTMPGERVNRPAFGSGLMQLVFAPASDELTTVTQFLVQGALQQWLGELIQVEDVDVAVRDAELTVTVAYRIRATGAPQTATFSRTQT
jgi:phage baseplate assembly protein W